MQKVYNDGVGVTVIKPGQEHLVQPTWVELSAAEIDLLKNPPKTQELLDAEASIARENAMMAGFIYNGVLISVTKEDGDGMMQVEATFNRIKVAIANGELPPGTEVKTVIKFKNGTMLPITDVEFNTFSLQFILERGKFFQ